MLKNLTSDTKTVTVNMTAWTIVYNGTLVHEVWKDSVTKSLNPEEGNTNCRLLGCHIFMVAGILLGLEHSYWNQINWLRKETAHGEQYKWGWCQPKYFHALEEKGGRHWHLIDKPQYSSHTILPNVQSASLYALMYYHI